MFAIFRILHELRCGGTAEQFFNLVNVVAASKNIYSVAKPPSINNLHGHTHFGGSLLQAGDVRL